MKGIPVADTRTFGIMGHTSSGKTTLVDALLFKLGVNDRFGAVSAGTSMADYMDEEKSRKITLFAKPFAATYKASGGKPHSLVFIDTPGYLDFFGQMVAASHAVDSVLIAVDAVAGISVGTHRAWKCCEGEGVTARAVVITGIDKDNASFEKVLASLQAAFGARCVPVVFPAGAGVVDVLGGGAIPAEAEGRVTEIKQRLMELAAETDEALTEKFLEGVELTPQEVADGLTRAISAGTFVPVFACAAPKSIGLNELLEGICRLLPSPLLRTFRDAEGAPVSPAETEPFVGLVWRTTNDPFVGQISFVRVVSGTLTADSEVINASRHQKERVGGLILLAGKKQEAIDKATAGDIVAIPKLKSSVVTDTLCAPGKERLLPKFVFPRPVMFQAVKGKTQADEDKIGIALGRVCEEDPTLHAVRNAETHETVLQGLGDVHLDVAVNMMKSRTHVDVVLSPPKVPYRETVAGRGEGHYKHKKQSGGRGQYGEVYLRVEPKPPTETEWFEDATVGGSIPHNFIPAVQKGLVDGMTSGAVAGYPVTDVKVTVYDGSYHDVDSSEIAFKIAAARALKEGLGKSRPVLLEPIMKVKVAVPDHYMGDINGDLNHKRGRILGVDAGDGMQVITAEVPQSELVRYAAELRSMTAGQGTFELEFSRYDIVPSNIAQRVIAESDRKRDVHEE